jgi:hypothetical protein
MIHSKIKSQPERKICVIGILECVLIQSRIKLKLKFFIARGKMIISDWSSCPDVEIKQAVKGGFE